MSAVEVPTPILNVPFEEPKLYWYIREGEEPQRREGRRTSIVYPPQNQKHEWDTSDGTLKKCSDPPSAYEIVLVNLIRERVKEWKKQGYPGASRTTLELLEYWQRDGREARLFFAQLEAAETIVFLNESRRTSGRESPCLWTIQAHSSSLTASKRSSAMRARWRQAAARRQ